MQVDICSKLKPEQHMNWKAIGLVAESDPTCLVALVFTYRLDGVLVPWYRTND